MHPPFSFFLSFSFVCCSFDEFSHDSCCGPFHQQLKKKNLTFTRKIVGFSCVQTLYPHHSIQQMVLNRLTELKIKSFIVVAYTCDAPAIGNWEKSRRRSRQIRNGNNNQEKKRWRNEKFWCKRQARRAAVGGGRTITPHRQQAANNFFGSETLLSTIFKIFKKFTFKANHLPFNRCCRVRPFFLSFSCAEQKLKMKDEWDWRPVEDAHLNLNFHLTNEANEKERRSGNGTTKVQLNLLGISCLLMRNGWTHNF